MTLSTSPQTIEKRVMDFIRERNLMSRRQKVLVAVSGGADSVCLLHVLVARQKELGVKLHVAHLDHMLRGQESASDARYVAELAKSLEIPATIESRYVKQYQAEHRLSLEEAAREVRYDFLARVAGEVGADRVAIGHTKDDHIETILLHLVRGSGVKGLCGLEALSRRGGLTIVRPLLEVTRQETSDYCEKHSLAPCVDSTNASLSPLRNRIRLQLLPQLRTYNPGVAEALLRTARIAADDIAFLEKQARKSWGEIEIQDDTVILDKRKFARLHPALQRHLLRASIEKLLGNLKDIEARHIEELMDALDKPAGKNISLPEGLHFFIEYDRYLLGREPLSPFPTLAGVTALTIPGTTEMPGWRIEASIGDHAALSKTQSLSDEIFTACFDLDKIEGRIIIRPRRTGDRFQPLGLGETKKLGHFMIDARIPQAWRARIPVVATEAQVVWLVGWRIDERVKVTAKTKRVLCLKLIKQ